ncbi:hypothetical protein GQ55_5G069200 [Panicum hallii var. hallii]|uniref:Uncharacterized protein n=1 Tax=Panicum hallii var. hallii TaxID=1504633 RepID=A0A2T7DDI7_9POAL|nr:hypothetical protein GQ55_5G069200 [Panicum hallii var. hallii]
MSTLENCNFRTPNITLCSLHLAAAGPSPWPRQAPAATGNSPWPSQNLAAGPGPCCLDAAGTGLCTRQHLAAGGLGPWPRQAPVAAGNGPCSLDAVGIDPCSLVRPDAAVQVGARARVQAADDEPGGRWRQRRRPLRPRPGRQHGERGGGGRRIVHAECDRVQHLREQPGACAARGERAGPSIRCRPRMRRRRRRLLRQRAAVDDGWRERERQRQGQRGHGGVLVEAVQLLLWHHHQQPEQQAEAARHRGLREP